MLSYTTDDMQALRRGNKHEMVYITPKEKREKDKEKKMDKE